MGNDGVSEREAFALEDTQQTGVGLEVADRRFAPGKTIGRYEIERELGRGGMGLVLKATDPTLLRSVAIKILVSGRALSASASQRLVREGQAIAQLAHPNIVAVYEIGVDDEEIFIAMEHVEGRSLRRWIAEEKPTRAKILDAFLQAGRGLAAAHKAGIIHRDFKPENVLVGDDRRVRVLDFGLARGQVDEDDDAREPSGGTKKLLKTITQTGTLMGTPAYMAPEQFSGADEVTERSDQFSFCVALFEALAGERPFAGDDLETLTRNVMKGTPRPWPRHVPRGLRTLIDQGLRTEPEARHSSVAELVERLHRETRGRRFGTWGAVVFGAAAIGAGLAFAFAGGSEQTERPTTEPSLETSLEQILPESGLRLNPQLTPDGSAVIYSDGQDLLRYTIADRAVTNLTADFEPAASELRISPSGTRIAFSADGDLYIAALDGTGLRKVTEKAYWPTWSPDESQIAFVTEQRYNLFVQDRDRSTADLWRVEVESGKRTPILIHEDGAKQPDWSPDGNRIVFLSGFGLSTIRIDGSDLRVSDYRKGWHPRWSADGSVIRLIREYRGRYEIASIPFDRDSKTLEVARVRSRAAIGRDRVWHFDLDDSFNGGKGRLVANSFVDEARTYRIGLDPKDQVATTPPIPFTDSNLKLISPAYSPDGSKLAFMSTLGPDEDIYITERDGTAGRGLGANMGYARAPVWRRDGKAITFQGSANTNWGLYEVLLDGSTNTIELKDDIYFPHWSSRGEQMTVTVRIYPPSTGGVDHPYVIRNVANPDRPAITAQTKPTLFGYRAAGFSPDDKQVALVGRRGLAVLDAKSGELTPLGVPAMDAAWLSNHSLIVVDGSTVSIVDRDSKESRKLTSLAPARATRLPSIDVAPDGTEVVVSARTETAKLWLVGFDQVR